ncbi:MAG: hypothetical protein U5N85_00155 [Arcicella sp.]|nr:hypothetical protein [Arcicella sp.]
MKISNRSSKNLNLKWINLLNYLLHVARINKVMAIVISSKFREKYLTGFRNQKNT